MSWEAAAAKEKVRIDESIPVEWRVQVPKEADSAMAFVKTSTLLSSDEADITSMSAVDLVKKLSAGELTCVAVTTAFCKRASLAHQLANTPTSHAL